MIQVKDFKVVLDRLTGDQIQTKYNPDHMINGGLYDNDTGKNMTFLTHDGINDGSYFSKCGIGFSGGKIKWCKQGEAEYFIGGSPVILADGKKVLDWGNQKSDYLKDHRHYRSWAGLTKDNKLILNVTSKPVYLNELQEEALSYGCYHAINLDGGGSCHLQLGKHIVKKSTRANASWILVWGESMKTNKGLVTHCKKALDEGWGYVWGTYGRVLSEYSLRLKAAQYPGIFTEKKLEYIRKNYIGRRTADCGGLIKSYLWWVGNDPVYTPSSDLAVDTMYQTSQENGEISSLPEIPGLIVWHEGHAGVYIGNGQVIEARGTLYGVVQTRLSDRPWTHWFKHPGIDYVQDDEVSDWAKPAQKWVMEKGISDGTRPKDVVTREELWTMLYRKENI